MEVKAVICLERAQPCLSFRFLLIFHVGTCNAAESNLECIKDGYILKEVKAQVT